jgi:hypothetical protein
MENILKCTCFVSDNLYTWVISYRKTIKKLFPAELAERKRSVETQPSYQKVIERFESFGKNRKNQNQRGSPGQPSRLLAISKTVAIVAGIFGVLMVNMFVCVCWVRMEGGYFCSVTLPLIPLTMIQCYELGFHMSLVCCCFLPLSCSLQGS